MPVIKTKTFGNISYQADSVFEFPGGLPGFEQHRRFVPVQLEESAPLVFLQSLEDLALCFVTLPVGAVDPGYRLLMTEEDQRAIGWTGDGLPRIGTDVLCLVVVSLKESGPTANLLAPVVVNLASRVAVQAIAPASDYSWEHPLLPVEAPVCS